MNRDPDRQAAVLGLVLVVLFWGGNFTVSKLALAEIPPLAFTALRFVLASAVFGVLIWRTEGHRPLPPGSFWPLLGLGAVGNTVYQLCFIEGLARTSVTNSTLILASMPPTLTVVAGLLGIEAISRRQRWAVAVATAGVLLVLSARGLSFSGAHVGDLLMLGAVACWTGYTLGLRKLALPMSPLRLTAWTMFTGTPGLVLAGVPELLRTDWAAVSPVAWWSLLYSALLSLVAAYVLWNRAVTTLGASRAALFSSLTPLVATSIAMLVLHERPTLRHAAGALLIVSAVVVATQAGRGPGAGRAGGR